MNKVSTLKKVIAVILILITLATIILAILNVIPFSVGIIVVLLIKIIASFM